jgi:hypothetical protein
MRTHKFSNVAKAPPISFRRILGFRKQPNALIHMIPITLTRSC